MNYQLTIAIKQRKCSACSKPITKGNKLFVMSDWPRGQQYPTKKNICLNCTPKLTDPEFVGFLKVLLRELENLAVMQTQASQKPDYSAIYACELCHSKVAFNEHFERYGCENLDCQQLYEIDEVKDLVKL